MKSSALSPSDALPPPRNRALGESWAVVQRVVALTLSAVVGAATAVPAQVSLTPRIDSMYSWHAAPALRARAADGSATRRDLLRLAEMELALGRPARAQAILEQRFPSGVPDADRLILLGTALRETGDHERAADAFHQAASILRGRDKGILLARAGDAAQRAGRRADAREHYANAATELPAIAGWLAIREAAVSDDPVRAIHLLRQAPRGAARLAAAVRADASLSAGDSVGALVALTQADLGLRALEIAAALGDTAAARAHSFALLRSSDTTELQAALTWIAAEFPPA
ncbi:MAG: hypothetical protein GTO06_09630, partial [Hydrogenophaga sp.]|nr:hypothetical protein [Hydrogenophaga sp.]